MNKKKVVKVESDDLYKGYKYLTNFLSCLNPLNKLTDRELELFSVLMYYNGIYNKVPKEHRGLLINTKEIKKNIASKMGVGSNNINTLLSSIKKKGALVDNLPVLDISLDEEDSFELIFKLDVVKKIKVSQPNRVKQNITDPPKSIQIQEKED